MTQLPSPEFFALQEAYAGRYSLDRELAAAACASFTSRDVALDTIDARLAHNDGSTPLPNC